MSLNNEFKVKTVLFIIISVR